MLYFKKLALNTRNDHLQLSYVNCTLGKLLYSVTPSTDYAGYLHGIEHNLSVKSMWTYFEEEYFCACSIFQNTVERRLSERQ